MEHSIERPTTTIACNFIEAENIHYSHTTERTAFLFFIKRLAAYHVLHPLCLESVCCATTTGCDVSVQTRCNTY